MELTDEQRAAVTCDAPLIALSATAGAGKTQVIISRTSWLIANGVLPSRICILTYTCAAAKNLQDRLSQPVGFVGTLHSFCLQLLRSHSMLIGYTSDVQVLSDEEAGEIFQETIEEHRYTGPLQAVANVLKAGPDALTAIGGASCVARDYWNKLKAANVVDYDLILLLALKALREQWETGISFDYLMVDESQDSSPIDVQIYEALPIPNKMFIYAPEQSVFDFRGSDCRYLEKWLHDAQATYLKLSGSFRCAKAICAVANKLLDSQMVALRDVVGDVWVRGFETVEDEIAYIVEYIKTDEPNPNEVALLLRYNALVDQYAAALRQAGIPVASRAQMPSDWGTAQKLVSFMSRPSDDRLCEQYMALRNGPETAKRARERAVSLLIPLAQYELSHTNPIPANQVLSILFDCNISKETFCAVEQIVAQLPSGYTHSDLLLAMREIELSAPMGSGVKVMTYWSAKGLEFPVCILPAFEQGIIPKNSDEEEKRIAYVALTRAQDQCIITHSKQRTLWNGACFGQKPSSFLATMGLI